MIVQLLLSVELFIMKCVLIFVIPNTVPRVLSSFLFLEMAVVKRLC